MLVPELQDIAEQLNISNFKKLNKQDLVNKILDSQASEAADKPATPAEKPRRKRTAKAAPGTAKPAAEAMPETTEVPVVQQEETPAAENSNIEAPVKRRKRKPIAAPAAVTIDETPGCGRRIGGGK